MLLEADAADAELAQGLSDRDGRIARMFDHPKAGCLLRSLFTIAKIRDQKRFLHRDHEIPRRPRKAGQVAAVHRIGYEQGFQIQFLKPLSETFHPLIAHSVSPASLYWVRMRRMHEVGRR